MNVAITIRADLEFSHLLSCNGIAQNAVFLYDVVKELGYETCFLHFDADFVPPDNIAGEPYSFISYQDCLDKDTSLDIILEVGVSLGVDQRAYVRQRFNSKVVVVRLGNSYWMDLEDVLFKPSDFAFGPVHAGADRVWISPHFEPTKQYHESLNQCPARICPFLWLPKFVSEQPVNYPAGSLEDIYVMEPNINVVKNALIPLCIISELFKRAPHCFGRASILNGLHINEKPVFLKNIIANLPGTSSEFDKVFFSGRYSFDHVFSNFGVLLGFQFQNGLNYLYNEALYRGVPLIHNSEFLRDVGYYYDDFNIRTGADQVERALNDGFQPKVVHENRQFLERYSPNDADVQNTYQSLLSELC